MNQTIKVGNYIRNGIFIGLVFPLFSYYICFFILQSTEDSFSIKLLHKQFPLLWIIDLAPFVLGIISYFVWANVNRLNKEYFSHVQIINDELQTKNEELNHYVHEKEVLLKEIHHRVKNNLQVITSLLSLQSSFIDDEKSKGLFRYSQYRINSMAMIHEMLYKSDNISLICFKDYCQNLVNQLLVSMKGSNNNIKVRLSIDDVCLKIDTAVPLGLIINEIVTNSLKYGIKGDRYGEIFIEIKKVRHNNYKMSIGDNGAGFAEDVTFRNSNSLGLLLIHKLSLQLKGYIEKDNEAQGTQYILIFQEIDQTSKL